MVWLDVSPTLDHSQGLPSHVHPSLKSAASTDMVTAASVYHLFS